MSEISFADTAGRRQADSSRILAFVLMAFIWGAGWLPTKLAMEVLPPIFFACLRFSLAALGFLAMVRLRGFALGVEQPGRVLAASMLITTACYSLVFWGLVQAPSGLAAVVNLGLMPIFLIGIGAAYGQEPITPLRVAASGSQRLSSASPGWDCCSPVALARAKRARRPQSASQR